MHVQMIPLSFDPSLSDAGDAKKWLADPLRDTRSRQKCAVNESIDLCFTDTGYVKGSGHIVGTFPGALTHTDNFILNHHYTAEREMSTNSKHMTLSESDTESSHEIIVIMEEDPVVTESATHLYERNPSVSTLLKYNKEMLHVLRSGTSFSAKRHNVVLVGHGSKDTNGTVQLARHSPRELAILISTLKTEFIFSPLGAISLISCSLGNYPYFMLQLLQDLWSLSVETNLHLYNSLLSVSPDGKIITITDGVWVAHDHNRKVTAKLDKRGDLLIIVELGCAGPKLTGFNGNVLYLQTLEWPSHPQMFVPVELRKKYPSIDCLEGLTWSLFWEENERRRAPDYVPDHVKVVWLTEPGSGEDKIVFKQITNIKDLLVEIRYNAREEAVSNLYYVLNECIYKVDGTNLSVSLAGKFMNTENQSEVEYFRQSFIEEQGVYSLHELRQDLKASKFNDFCRQTFQFQECNYNCERWGRYFMAAVFSASVRNFRTFSLFLMSVIGCEVGRSRGTDSSLCTAFVGDDHPMVTMQPWPEHLRRGFYGCTVDNYEMAVQDRQIWLEQIVAKENALYMKSKQMMNAVDHDEQTELEIFGRVKVMNTYVFSSFLEFFRGTPEGKKLKQGCSFHENLNP
ncbi:uncharacterized protein LOC115051115 [Echeneis naucrates]|uniref:uncharacterized protein LOC115051115 n=1 Tax=Echeneis naucrates TaxID=173247 RepID=UPI001113B2FD|nr:uncharacterized protein LOC115051115 [Echeneis naucrates]